MNADESDWLQLRKINYSLLIFQFKLTSRFRLKYHPEDSVKRKEEQMAALKVRFIFFNTALIVSIKILF